MFRVTALSCVLILSASPALAQATAPAAPPQAQQQAAPAKKICKSEVSTGSIMPKRTCKTADEWAAISAANRNVTEQLRQYQQNDRTVSGSR